MSTATSVTISLALMLLFGFLLSRLLRLLRLPNVTAYILAGILLGPYGLGLVPPQVIAGMDFLPDLALCFIAFSVGEFFEFETLKKNGMKVVVITLMESLAASVVIFIATYFVMDLGLAFSVMLSALAAVTAPASTIMTIRQTRAKGDLVNTLLQVVALDDVVGLVAYSIAISVALSSIRGAGADRTARDVRAPDFAGLRRCGAALREERRGGKEEGEKRGRGGDRNCLHGCDGVAGLESLSFRR